MITDDERRENTAQAMYGLTLVKDGVTDVEALWKYVRILEAKKRDLTALLASKEIPYD